ncbi:EF-P 5-aminopentanol modification-associated protein YfmF [Streptococcus oricebi]|uniref:Insulinase family protein n=1 Tax=Streptococcus oricebi TaxID=1547447 RepID=A0ABS5B5K3_9STRE|nr:pitrilysin family protein [Streptococcus oricebi]MBP2624122.1 insulinase family protein [Streptococcus oricebi]
MEIVTGVNLHFIKSQKFKTNKIKFRFSAPMRQETVAGRVLAASMLETANRLYPTSQIFREKLANLYGANYTTSLSKRGLVHYVDINLSFVRDSFLSRKNTLTNEMIDFLKASLLAPLADETAFDLSTFEVEKKNVITALEAEIENHFYHAHQELNKLFYLEEEMKIPRVSTIDLIKKETAETSFSVFQNMLKEDRIDIFFIGDFNEVAMKESFESFGFGPREMELELTYQQDFSKVLKEGLEQKDVNQSILEMAYHFDIQYGEEGHLPLIVLNGLLGTYAHSKLFVKVREAEGIAYTVSSRFDIFSGMMRVYAGIDRKNRNKAMSLINRQIADLKKGNFTLEELNQTKLMLKNSALLAQDKQNTLLERAYLQSVLGKKLLPLDLWLAKLEKVTTKDVILAASRLKLQAIYFMEGK